MSRAKWEAAKARIEFTLEERRRELLWRAGFYDDPETTVGEAVERLSTLKLTDPEVYRLMEEGDRLARAWREAGEDPDLLPPLVRLQLEAEAEDRMERTPVWATS